MIEQTSNINAAFMEVTSKKIEVQDKKFLAIEEKIKNIPDNAEVVQKLISSIDKLQEDVNASRFPADKISDFSSRLDLSINLLKHPVQNKVVHHHQVPKLIWITAGLFVAFSLVCAGWYNTGNKLNIYIANDSKYRYLRQDTCFRKLQFYLDVTDSLYNTKPDFRQTVLEAEEKDRENFERLKKAERLKSEANELERGTKKR